MIQKNRISLVVPCKNESKIIGGFIQRVPSYIDEIIIIDNNSTDNTTQVALRTGARVVKEKRSVNGIGYGYAHSKGLHEATGDFIVAMDGDDTYPLSSIKQIIKLMETKRIDFVSCNRFPLKNPKAISPLRQLGIHILNIETKILYGYSIKDILTGMWVIRKTIAKDLNIKSGDWNYSPEIKIAAIRHPNIVFEEYHIDHFERINEISKQNLLKTGLLHMWFLFRYRIHIDFSSILSFCFGDRIMELGTQE